MAKSIVFLSENISGESVINSPFNAKLRQLDDREDRERSVDVSGSGRAVGSLEMRSNHSCTDPHEEDIRENQISI